MTSASVGSTSPTFLITIDTEGDNLWGRPREITTRNLAFLPRFQALAEKHGFKPTYLSNWEAVVDEGYQAFARDVIARGQGEVGLHIHAWNSPPITPLTDDDLHHQPYLTEYPESVLREKVRFMTDLLEQTFERKMVSHRGGRWAFDATYARALLDFGYRVDCSVTPHVSWKRVPGDPNGNGGPDCTDAPDAPYYVGWAEPAPGQPWLLEVPMTILKRRRSPPERWLRKALGRQVDRLLWMQPTGRNLPQLLDVVDSAVADGREHLEFTLHSSEFMPGGSPTFRTEDDIERLYDHMEALFERIARRFTGQTLAEFAERYVETHQPPILPRPARKSSEIGSPPPSAVAAAPPL